MRIVGLPKGDGVEPVPPLSELFDVLPVPVVDRLLDVPPVAVVRVLVPAAPLPNTAVPVSSKRLCSGGGTVSAATLPLAVDVALPDDAAGAQAAATAARVVLPTLPVPVTVPALVDRELVPLELLLKAAAAVPVELVPVLTVAVPAALPEVVLLLPAVIEPWQAARPTETITAGTIVR